MKGLKICILSVSQWHGYLIKTCSFFFPFFPFSFFSPELLTLLSLCSVSPFCQPSVFWGEQPRGYQGELELTEARRLGQEGKGTQHRGWGCRHRGLVMQKPCRRRGTEGVAGWGNWILKRAGWGREWLKNGNLPKRRPSLRMERQHDGWRGAYGRWR